LKALRLPQYPLILAGLILYLALTAYRVADGNYLLLAAPLLGAGFYALVRYPKILFLAVAALTPFSVILHPIPNTSFIFPTEPLIVVIMGLYLLSHLITPAFDRRVIQHPLTILLLLNLGWMLICTFTSTMPIVSLKYFMMRLWYVTVFYFMALDVFRYFGSIRWFLGLLVSAMALVIIYATLHHLTLGLSQDLAARAPNPFFKDHTIYGATVALMIPIGVSFALFRRPFGNSQWMRYAAFVISPILLLGLFLSFSRAAWVSVVVAALAFVVFYLKIRFRTLIIWGVITGSLLTIYWTPITLFFKENEATSDKGIQQQLQSMYNITNDASNTERINRWFSAWRMFKDRPVFGHGPGTYQFTYAPYQRHYQKTKISTNFGDRGNAHSEYLGPLAEFGILGMLTKIGLLFVSLYKGMQLYQKGKNRTVRLTALTITLALITYFTHGFLNNFLNYDKAAIPFFAFLAILTALDVYYNKEPQQFDITHRPEP
jgi:putative inorganic carbon (HCO3(-)) transporter